jgi:glycosyltransferase involved in cell wall biosynthesis
MGLIGAEATELIVSSGVDVERFRPSLAAPAESLRVVMLSRLLWEKGVGEFVDAAKRCKRRLPNARFQIAGEFDPDHPSGIPPKVVDQWVAEGAVEYLGHVSNVPELLSQATLAVLPSYREGVPRVLLEAAACGIPVITCDAPGCREAVENRVTGLLVPPKDADALADAMSMLLSDAELRRRMGLAGRRRIKIHFDQRVIVDKHLELYRRIGVPLKLSEKRLTPHALVA